MCVRALNVSRYKFNLCMRWPPDTISEFLLSLILSPVMPHGNTAMIIVMYIIRMKVVKINHRVVRLNK